MCIHVFYRLLLFVCKIIKDVWAVSVVKELKGFTNRFFNFYKKMSFAHSNDRTK